MQFDPDIFLDLTSFYVMQVSAIFVTYYAYPKKVTIEVTPAQVPFPSISVCNMRNLDVYILDTLNKYVFKRRPIATSVVKSFTTSPPHSKF